MQPTLPRLLVVDDDPSMRDLLGVRLSKGGFEPTLNESATQALRTLDTERFDVIVTDVCMNEMDGIAFCERVALNQPDIPVIVMTAHSSIDTVVAALRAKAFDFLSKPPDMDHLFSTLQAALRYRTARTSLARLSSSSLGPDASDGIIGSSRAIADVLELVARVAPLEASVLIAGESGTGKELIARAIHNGSRRKTGPFVGTNCAAIPETLLEAELFGYVRGAFTGARTDRKGLFEQAKGGTILLDEIGELPVHLQPKLLRALQERAIRPIGCDREVPIDVRVIAASNKDLGALMKSGQFREDLYYRINVIELTVPPLREREEDILLCAKHFIDLYAKTAERPIIGMTPEAADRLLSYSWPGNVRELQNTIERAVAFARYERITVDDLPEPIRRYRPSMQTRHPEHADLRPLEEVERAHIARVLEATGGNKTLAAQILGVDRRTLYRKQERTRDHT